MSENDKKDSRVRITVIIANHNYGEWIEQAIESAKFQVVDNAIIRVAVFDDASTDKSPDILKDAKVSVIFNRNHPVGPSRARNELINRTLNDTDLYAVLDADDYWLPGKLQKSVDIFKNNTNVGVVYTDNYLLNVKTGLQTREFRESFSLERLLKQCYIHSGSVISKEVFEKEGLYREDMRTAEDWDLWIRAARSFKIFHIPEPLVVARIHKDNSTYSVSGQIWQNNWAKISETIRELYAQ